MALRVPEICFWPENSRKNLNFLRYIHVFSPCAHILFRHKWRKLATVFLSLHCVDGNICLGYCNEFFSMFQVFDWSFFVLQCHGNVCNWNLDMNWSRLCFFGVFCWSRPRFADFISIWTETCMNCSDVTTFRPHQFFSIVRLTCSLVCSFTMLVLFSHSILQHLLISFIIAMQLYFPSFCVFQSISPESCGEISLRLLLNQSFRFQCFV